MGGPVKRLKLKRGNVEDKRLNFFFFFRVNIPKIKFTLNNEGKKIELKMDQSIYFFFKIKLREKFMFQKNFSDECTVRQMYYK